MTRRRHDDTCTLPLQYTTWLYDYSIVTVLWLIVRWRHDDRHTPAVLDYCDDLTVHGMTCAQRPTMLCLRCDGTVRTVCSGYDDTTRYETMIELWLYQLVAVHMTRWRLCHNTAHCGRYDITLTINTLHTTLLLIDVYAMTTMLWYDTGTVSTVDYSCLIVDWLCDDCHRLSWWLVCMTVWWWWQSTVQRWPVDDRDYDRDDNSMMAQIDWWQIDYWWQYQYDDDDDDWWLWLWDDIYRHDLWRCTYGYDSTWHTMTTTWWLLIRLIIVRWHGMLWLRHDNHGYVRFMLCQRRWPSIDWLDWLSVWLYVMTIMYLRYNDSTVLMYTPSTWKFTRQQALLTVDMIDY